jgi:hypothetical protein
MRFAAFALLLFASPAIGATWDFGCDDDTANDINFTIQPQATSAGPVQAHRGCFEFTDADSTTTSRTIQVAAETALVCFDPDTAATTTSAARVKIRKCPGGTKPASNPSNECIDMGGAATGESALDGTEGHPDVQNACMRVPRGVYYVDVTVACVAADFCRVTFEGE